MLTCILLSVFIVCTIVSLIELECGEIAGHLKNWCTESGIVGDKRDEVGLVASVVELAADGTGTGVHGMREAIVEIDVNFNGELFCAFPLTFVIEEVYGIGFMAKHSFSFLLGFLSFFWFPYHGAP